MMQSTETCLCLLFIGAANLFTKTTLLQSVYVLSAIEIMVSVTLLKVKNKCCNRHKSRRGLVVKALDSYARGCGFKSCLAQDKDYWWGKVTGANLHKCTHFPGHCPFWLGNRLRSKSSMLQKKFF